MRYTSLGMVLWLSAALAQAQAEKLAEPSAPALQEAEKLVKEVYKDEYAKRSAEDRRDLAGRLLAEGRNTQTDRTSQYVLLREARDLAMQSADMETALAAINEMEKAFTVNGAEMKLKVFTGLRSTLRLPEDNQIAAEAALVFVDEALDAENYDAATRAAELLVGFATAGKNMALASQAQLKKGEIRARAAGFLEMKIAADKLQKDPEDRQAKYAVGSYAALYKNDWEKGLQLISEGSDAAWSAVAKADLANPTDVAEMVKLADQWWDLGLKQPALKARIWNRAEFWYNLALPAADGLIRTKVAGRLEQIAATKTAVTANLSEATRRALPTTTEMRQLRDAYSMYRAGNSARYQEFLALRQTIMMRLQQGLTTGSDADFFARCRADLQMRQLMLQGQPLNTMSDQYSLLLNNFGSFAATAKSQEDLAARLLGLERFIATEKPGLDPTVIDSWVYTAIRNFTSNNVQQYGTQANRLRLCGFLKTRGVRSAGLERYRSYTERGR